MRSFNLWIGKRILAWWRWERRHPDLVRIGRVGAWLVALVLFMLAAFLALAVPDKGLLVKSW